MTKTISKEILNKREQAVKLGQEDMLDADIPSLEDFAEEYLSYVRDTVKKRSWDRDELALRHLVDFYKGRILSNIKPQDIDDYKSSRLSKVSPATVNRELQVFRHLFNLASRWNKFFGKNPVSISGLLAVNNQKERILGYIYAVLHSPAYRTKYMEFLKTDFPYIPFVTDRRTFEKLSALGQELIRAHLLHDIPDLQLGDYQSKGNHEVEKPVWTNEKLYINKESWFEPVPEDVWQYTVGGYQVLERYMKYRKGRELSLLEIENIEKVIKILAFTIEQMEKIDRINFS